MQSVNTVDDDYTSCKPRPYVKYTTKVTELALYRQPIIIVQKCSGYEGKHNNFLCVPTNITNLKTKDGELTFRNHNDCEMKCVCNVDGVCPPRDTFDGEVPCPDGLK